ncbi:hypothetical protein GCM10010503_55840 [Streptomyces lucensis JCM 4490]|uniref:NlpC/P60 domain-containing protein n=1 Tax=Streptomyces lucensis JCM 4490 TaxID=1306176 RepID=A0A918MUI3_9ACTN|nr:NlpC/P60 family protein [Streptomyces lucensis]GGW71264.1 hypothetical protein GCM10010503_55840 [Streptomyces lucensis JCM 4490]
MAPESRDEVRQRIDSLYEQAENATGNFNATRAMAARTRSRGVPLAKRRGRRPDPALDEVARQWFDAARAKLGPTVPAVLPADRQPDGPAAPPRSREGWWSGLPDGGRELLGLPSGGRETPALPGGARAALEPGPAGRRPEALERGADRPVAELTAGPAADAAGRSWPAREDDRTTPPGAPGRELPQGAAESTGLALTGPAGAGAPAPGMGAPAVSAGGGMRGTPGSGTPGSTPGPPGLGGPGQAPGPAGAAVPAPGQDPVAPGTPESLGLGTPGPTARFAALDGLRSAPQPAGAGLPQLAAEPGTTWSSGEWALPGAPGPLGLGVPGTTTQFPAPDGLVPASATTAAVMPQQATESRGVVATGPETAGFGAYGSATGVPESRVAEAVAPGFGTAEAVAPGFAEAALPSVATLPTAQPAPVRGPRTLPGSAAAGRPSPADLKDGNRRRITAAGDLLSRYAAQLAAPSTGVQPAVPLVAQGAQATGQWQQPQWATPGVPVTAAPAPATPTAPAVPGAATSAAPTTGTGSLPLPLPASGSPRAVRAAKAIAFARAQLGKPCVWGATGPDSYDCSSLTQAAWKAAGVSLPRAAHRQALAGSPVTLAGLEPGDLVLFFDDDRHVGLHVGDGMMVHAPGPGSSIREESIYGAGEAAIHRIVRPA